MSDIEQRVRHVLNKLQLKKREREEVFAEIADHLELVVQELVATGVQQEDAVREAFAHLDRPKQLMKRIQGAKESGMDDRFRRLWLPGIIVGFLAYASQMIILRLVPWPSSVHVFGQYYSYTWEWIIAVVGLGAFGAWWSRQMGGSVRERIVVALAPAEIMAAAIAVMLPLDCVIEAWIDRSVPYAIRHPQVLLAGILWMLHCAVPAMLGAMPFLFGNTIKRTEAIS